MAESGIKGGGLKSYCITRWTTSSESVNSVLNLKPVLEKMANEYENLLTNYHVPLKSGVYARLAKTALSIGQNLEFDLEQSRALCSQLSQYRKKELPFDLEFGYGFQKPINWWNLIETKPDPESLPLVALHFFSICPNSASCEREKPIRRTINGEIIPNDNVIVLIENIWIENEIDLSNDLILNGIGNIPKDLDDDFIDNEKNNNDENIVLTDDEIVDNTNGRGILNYNVNDLLNKYVNENQ
ncbi:unnamed protein product [Rhizophagus irregularis]|nr:unnamed protein product [Rhizophagus irregularis]